jgi:diguanylate cyclase (GGDEF)-like protein
MKGINFIISLSMLTITVLLLIGLIKIFIYSNFELFDNKKYINLSNDTEYLIPKHNQNIDINHITNYFKNEFIKNNIKNIYFGENSKNVWLRLNLHDKNINTTNDKNIIYTDCKFIENIEFYIPTTDGIFITVKPKQYFIFPYIDFPKNIDFHKDIYIKLTSNANVFNIFLTKDSDFYISQSVLACFYVGNLGILLGMAMMNITLFFSSKDKKYLFHSFFIGSLLSLLYAFSGMQVMPLGFVSDNEIIALVSMVSLTWVLFIYSYLDIKDNISILNKFFMILISLLTFSVYASQIIPSRFTYVIIYFCIFITGLCIIISVYSYLKFKIGSMYYLIGALILFTSIILYTFAFNGLLEYNILTSNAWYAASSIETLLFIVGIIEQIKDEKEKNNQLQMEVVTDKLTTLYNRRYFEETVKSRIIDLDMKKSAVSMLLLDIDHFKNVNDTYGHNVGDSVLAESAMLIKQCLRKEDMLVRWGGEEFVAILPFTNVQEAAVIAEKIRSSIDSHMFKYMNKATVSIGVAEKTVRESFETWFKKVDKAMYKAKEDGRNRVCCVYYQNEVSI